MSLFSKKTVRLHTDKLLRLERRLELTELTFSDYVRQLIDNDLDSAADNSRIFDALQTIETDIAKPKNVEVETLFLLREMAGKELVTKVHNQLKSISIRPYTKVSFNLEKE